MDPDLDTPATKRDLLELEAKLDAKLDALETKLDTKLDAKLDAKLDVFAAKLDERLRSLQTELDHSVGENIARAAKAMMEHATDLFRVADDSVKATGARLDVHVADATVHRAPPRRAR